MRNKLTSNHQDSQITYTQSPLFKTHVIIQYNPMKIKKKSPLRRQILLILNLQAYKIR